ncbi:MAG: ParB N-terminal domain-containing protein, partial [Nitrospirae bacterium]|nr:ParB N-terminal domain-containing protein [Nitrospirota bacterium]
MTKKALGRGLGTLIPGAGVPQEQEEDTGPSAEVEIARIVPNRFQPRQVFEDKALEELADSIRIHGVIQPVLVRRLNNGAYELIAGE